jgi:hypothetical protein
VVVEGLRIRVRVVCAIVLSLEPTAPSGTYSPCSIHKSGVSATDSNGTDIKTSPVIFGQVKAREEDLNEAREVESREGFENTSGYS